MPEKSTKLIPYQVDYYCDECGEKMVCNNVSLTTYPAQYCHRCKNGHGKNFYVAYPGTDYEFERGPTQRILDAAIALKNWLGQLSRHDN